MVSLAGRGVHSGQRCQVWLHPSEGAVRFRRGRVEIPAQIDRLVGAERSTVLAADGACVAQVEHLLAALHVRGRWRGVLIEASSDELPILDGSARMWLSALDALPPPGPPPSALRPSASISLKRGSSIATVTPGRPRLCYDIDFDHPAIGRQRWCGSPADYAGLAAARTFGFLREAAGLRARGFATASSFDNAIVFGEEGPLNALRFADEPVRHKALDALGDMFLLGRPIDAKVSFERGSHAVHLALTATLAATLSTSEVTR